MDTTDVAPEGSEPNPAPGEPAAPTQQAHDAQQAQHTQQAHEARQAHEAQQAQPDAEPQASSPRAGHRRLRHTGVAFLAGVCCLFIFLSAITVWIHQTVISTDGFVATVGPIIERPAVTDTMSVQLTNQVFDVIDVEGRLKQILPGVTAALAGPLTTAASGFVHDQVLTVLRSPTFRTLWRSVLRTTHGQVIAALRGNSKALTVTNGAVVLNVLPLLDTALQQIQSLISGLLGRNITLPRIESTQISPEALASLSNSLGVQLPSDFGQIELARSSSVDLARGGVQLVDVLFWLLPLLTLLVLVATVWLSTNRRRTLLQVLVGTAVALVVLRRLGAWLQSRILASVNPTQRAAAGGAIHQVLGGLVTATWWLLVIALAAIAFLLIAGPYAWARSVRRRAVDLAAGSGRPGDEQRVAWLDRHRATMQVAGAVIGGLLLLIAPGWWFFVVAGLLVCYELALWRAGPHPDRELTLSPP